MVKSFHLYSVPDTILNNAVASIVLPLLHTLETGINIWWMLPGPAGLCGHSPATPVGYRGCGASRFAVFRSLGIRVLNPGLRLQVRLESGYRVHCLS